MVTRTITMPMAITITISISKANKCLRNGGAPWVLVFFLVWLPALCRLRQEGFDPALFPPLLFSNLLIYKTNTLSACQGAMARFARL